MLNKAVASADRPGQAQEFGPGGINDDQTIDAQPGKLGQVNVAAKVVELGIGLNSVAMAPKSSGTMLVSVKVRLPMTSVALVPVIAKDPKVSPSLSTRSR